VPEPIAATKDNPGCRVLICEGEKDADTVVKLGYVATCSPFGALKWRAEYSKYFTGCDVVIIEDNDERGRQHAHRVAASVKKFARSVRIVSMPDGVKGLTELYERENKNEQSNT